MLCVSKSSIFERSVDSVIRVLVSGAHCSISLIKSLQLVRSIVRSGKSVSIRRAADDVRDERGVDCGVAVDAGVLGVSGKTGGAAGVFAGAGGGGGGVCSAVVVPAAGEGVGMAGAGDDDADVERLFRGLVLRFVYSSIACNWRLIRSSSARFC